MPVFTGMTETEAALGPCVVTHMSDEGLKRRPHRRPVEQPLDPSLHVGQLVPDGCLIALQPSEKRDESDVGEGVIAGDIFTAGHFAIEGC